MANDGTAIAPEKTFLGHPRGLSTLFFTEMWERFSYYGMRAFLILYMVAPAASGGLGFTDANAASIYGTYTGSAWAASILGGLMADRLLGQYRTVLLGGVVIALGHFTLAFHALPFFYTGLAFIAFGTGCLKPNVSTLVGPLIAGYLAQKVGWHIGFACAGVGMTAGLIQYVLGRERLKAGIARLGQKPAAPTAETAAAQRTAEAKGALSGDEWKRIGAIVIFFLAASIFWGGYEQAGSTLNLFADRFTRTEIFGFAFPSSWFQ